MTTVTAKTLRDNLSQYLDRVEKGEEIMIIRHSEIIGTLKPAHLTAPSNGIALNAMFERNKKFFQSNKNLTDENVSTKEIYHQTLDEKYGL